MSSEQGLSNNQTALTFEQQRDNLQSYIDMGEKMSRLLDNQDFIDIFEEDYIKGWALTQTHNVAAYNPQRRPAVMEEMLARSIFSRRIEEIIQNGNTAKLELRELLEMQKDDEDEGTEHF